MNQLQKDRLERRQVEALESIARSLEKLVNPQITRELSDREIVEKIAKSTTDGPPWRVPGE